MYSPVIVVLNLPAAFLIDGFVATRYGLVADDVDLVAVRTDELLQDATDDGRHAGRYDDSRDVVCQSPLEVLVEVRVEGDVLDEVVDALGEGTGDRVHHLAERISVIGVRQWLVGVSVLPVFLIGVAVTCEFT
jgi:hypothetical protein